MTVMSGLLALTQRNVQNALSHLTGGHGAPALPSARLSR